MTKILMTSVRDDEQAAIDQFAREHNIDIVTTPKLIDDAVDLTKDVDGLVIQQRSPVDPAVYPQLKAHGLKQIATRTAGFDVKPREEMRGIVEYVSKEDLLRQSDVVSLHVDLNPTSTGLIAAPDLALMKPTAGLVNASRGPVVVTADLVAALKDHQLAAAALDTFEGENEVVMTDRREKGLADVPLVEELHAMDNVILTPHIAFFTNLAVKNMVDFALEDVLLILAGKHSPHEV